jgi:molybdopterin molybdotransferase
MVKQKLKERGQNIHPKGANRQKGTVLVEEGALLGSAEIAVAATVGKSMLNVTAPPRVAVISTGDELVDIDSDPLPQQIRRSNVYAISAALREVGTNAELFHLQDEKGLIFEELGDILEQFDVLILSGGVSKGKLDYIPEVLEKRGVRKKFHKVRQRPGKPFWFGTSDKAVVFALPGNPVSSFMCYYRYIQPWMKKQLGAKSNTVLRARLTEDFTFNKKLTYFLQVKIQGGKNGILEALPVKGKGSSDFANLCRGDGFMELPEHQSYFQAGESFPLYLYRSL